MCGKQTTNRGAETNTYQRFSNLVSMRPLYRVAACHLTGTAFVLTQLSLAVN